jgi:hypothetical protein
MSVPARLFLLRFTHTLVFAICVATLIPFTAYATTGEGRQWALWALIPPVGVFIGLMLNGGRCILQTLARRWTGTPDGLWARDIFFLPESWAVRVVKVMLPIFVLAIGAVAGRLAVEAALG